MIILNCLIISALIISCYTYAECDLSAPPLRPEVISNLVISISDEGVETLKESASSPLSAVLLWRWNELTKKMDKKDLFKNIVPFIETYDPAGYIFFIEHMRSNLDLSIYIENEEHLVDRLLKNKHPDVIKGVSINIISNSNDIDQLNLAHDLLLNISLAEDPAVYKWLAKSAKKIENKKLYAIYLITAFSSGETELLDDVVELYDQHGCESVARILKLMKSPKEH